MSVTIFPMIFFFAFCTISTLNMRVVTQRQSHCSSIFESCGIVLWWKTNLHVWVIFFCWTSWHWARQRQAIRILAITKKHDNPSNGCIECSSSIELYIYYIMSHCPFLHTFRHYSHLLTHQPYWLLGPSSQHIRGRCFIWELFWVFRLFCALFNFLGRLKYKYMYCAVSRIRTRDLWIKKRIW